MGFADVAELIVLLKLKDQISGPLKNIDRNMKGFARSTDSAATKIGKGIGVGLRNMATLAVAGAAALGTVAVASTKWAGDFEAQLNTINTVARETPSGLAAIGVSIRKLAKDTGTSLEDLTAGYYDLVSAGIKAKDATQVLTAANTLAIGGLSTTAEAVDLLTTAINTYGGDATKAGHISDVFAKSIERGKVTAAGLAGSFATVGPIAANAKIEIEELAAGYARLTSAGVPAAEASTQMRSAIQALTKTTPDLEKLQKQTGKNYLAIAGKKGLVFALQQMRTDAKKAGVPLSDLVGRIEATSFILQTTGPNFAAYNADLAAMGKATGTAAAQMAERQQGLNFQLARLKSNLRDAGITIGASLLPPLTDLTSKLVTLIQDHEGDIKQFGVTLGSALTTAFSSKNIAAAEKFAREILPTIASGLKLTASVAKGALDAFNSLPNEVKSIAIAALVGNKLTGGLVASGLGDIAKNAITGGGLLGRGSSPANPLFVADVAGGGVGGIAGKAGGLLNIVSKVFVVGLAAEAATQLAGPISQAGLDLNKQLFGPGGGPLAGFGKAWEDWRRNADWPFGQKNAPEWASLGGGAAPGSGGVAGRAGAAKGLTNDRDAQRDLKRELQYNAGEAHRLGINVKDLSSSVRKQHASNIALFRRERIALHGRNQIATLGSGSKQDSLLVAEALAVKFSRSQAPFYQNAKNQTRALDGLKALQARFLAQGDTKSAARIARAIATVKGSTDGVKAAIKAQKPPSVSITVPVSVSVRDAQKAASISIQYGKSYQGNERGK